MLSTHTPFLLRTKLSHPCIAKDAVERVRLLQRLDCLTPLTLVIAPAGYGKTTLLSMWVRQNSLPHAWLSLDADDGNLNIFLAYFVTAVQTVFPDFGSEVAALLGIAAMPPVATLAKMLLNACDQIGEEFIVVLDDYHTISEPSIHQLISELLRSPSPWLHLAISTRSEPSLSLAVARAHGNLTEIRAHDLSFTEAEALHLFANVECPEIDAQTVRALMERAEGWPASLHLARLYLRQQPDFGSLSDVIEGSSRQLMEYLTAEILSQLPPHMKTFLVRTAILDRLCASLCAFVVRDGLSLAAGQDALRWLETNGVFTTALDEHEEWFRVHPLFRRLLQAQLGAVQSNEEIAELHYRASAWHLAQGQIADAIRHALAAGNTEMAVQIVTRVRTDVINREEWHRLERWLALFPHMVIDQQPELLMARAWLMHSHYRLNKVQEIVGQVQTLLAAPPDPRPTEEMDSWSHLQGEIEVFLTYFCYWRSDMTGVWQHGHVALERTPQGFWYARLLAVMFLSGAYLSRGDGSGAYAVYQSGSDQANAFTCAFQMRMLSERMFLRQVAGHLSELATDAGQVLVLSKECHRALSVGWAHCFLGIVHYHRNELTDAERTLSKIITQPYELHPQCFVQSICVLCLTYQLQQRDDEADRLVQFALSHLAEINHPTLIADMRAFQAELALRRGDLERAVSLTQYLSFSTLPQMPDFYAPHVTLAKLFLTQGTAESLRSARRLLKKLHDYAEAMGNVNRLIEVLLLEAWERQLHSDSQTALQKLERALHLALSGGYVRLFADLGHVLDPLLAQLAEQGAAPLLIPSIRAAILSVRPQQSVAVTSLDDQPSEADILVTLTFREQDVLRLLGQRHTNQEIARILSISPDTAKRHTVNIFRKLNLSNRREAALYATRHFAQPHYSVVDHDLAHFAPA